jgi:hypothetical protein
MVGSGIAFNDKISAVWFDVGNFKTPWQHGEEVIMIIEAFKAREVYCNVVSFELNEAIDIQELGTIELIPVTKVLRTNEHVIGYSEYQDNVRLNHQPVAIGDLQLVASGDIRLVVRGGHETVHGSHGPQSVPDEMVPITYACAVSPNPFADRISIQYALPHATNIDIAVYDVTGRQVRTVATGVQEPGSYCVCWYGTDDRGLEVSAGVYFVQMKATGYESQHKVILIH